MELPAETAAPDLPRPDAMVAAAFAPRARRRLAVFGAEVELVWLPERIARPGFPGPERAAFRSDAAARIVAEESVWRGPAVALTPNRYPFAADQGVWWSLRATREHDAAFWTVLFHWVDQRGGTVLSNSIGAAASIPRAHAHSTSEQLPFLSGLAEEPLAADWLPEGAGVSFVRKRVPFLLVAVRGPARERALATATLQVRRMTAASNVVARAGETWIYPRSPHETPAPHFPYALGAAELWGRWCFVDEAKFAAASGQDLERALVQAGVPPLPVG